jgi:glutaminase
MSIRSASASLWNPLVNAGAIATTILVSGKNADEK